MPYSDPPTGDAALDGVYYIDLSTDSDFPTYIVTKGENLTFDDQINGIGNAAWQYTFSATDIDGNPIIQHNFMGDIILSPYFVGPWWSFYRIRCGTDVIHEGVITNFHNKLGDQFLSVAGKTWEVYMSRWEYPFDGRDGHIYDYAFSKTFQGNELIASGSDILDTGLIYQAYQRDTVKILDDLISNAMNLVPNRIVFDLSGLVSSGVLTNYQISVGETNKFDSIISNLASIGDGFDWWIGHGKRFYTGTPQRYGNQHSPIISYYVTVDTPGLLNLEFDNQGPAATHVQGRGAGFASGTQLARGMGYGGAQTTYTRLDETTDFGDVRNAAQLETMTRRKLATSLNAVHDIPLSLDPAQIPGFWSTFRKGRAIHILADLYFHTIQSPQQILSYNCTVSNEGNAKVDFKLDQIYDQDYDVGDFTL